MDTDHLYALRMNYQEYYTYDENEIIKLLKTDIINEGFTENEANLNLQAFYQLFNINLELDYLNTINTTDTIDNLSGQLGNIILNNFMQDNPFNINNILLQRINNIINISQNNFNNTNSNTILSDTDISDTDFSDTDSSDTNSSDTDSSDTDISDTDISNTDISNTDISNTDISNTDISNTNISNIDISNTNINNNNNNNNEFNNIQNIYDTTSYLHYLLINLTNNLSSELRNDSLNEYQNNLDIHEDILCTLHEKDQENLKTYKLNETINYTCNICLDNLKKNNNIIELKCEHKFHKKCIMKWLKNYNYKCPICKVPVGAPNYNI